ncbi:MAG: hypothetical protein ACE5EC_09230, partial [Phycisphaerae bacterium]
EPFLTCDQGKGYLLEKKVPMVRVKTHPCRRITLSASARVLPNQALPRLSVGLAPSANPLETSAKDQTVVPAVLIPPDNNPNSKEH